MLDELATPSPFSQLSQPITRSRSQITVLRILYRDSGLSPYACYVLTQILLRDVRPLLSPLPHLPIRNPTAMLRLKSTAGPAQLSLFEAMRCWHRNMAQLYIDGKGSLDLCADMAEALGQWRSVPAGPVVGVNVQV
jgi:DNA ligase-4